MARHPVVLALVAASLLSLALALPIGEQVLTGDAPAVSDELATEIGAKASTWTAVQHKESKFRGMTMSDVKSLMGALKEPEEMKAAPRTDYATKGPLPDNFDARTNWPKCTSIAHIRDQSTCGSCWAFGAVEAMSDRLCIASNASITDDLSAEDMLSCCLIRCGMGCNGGFPTGAWGFFKQHGLTTEAKYPYAFPPCEHHTNGSHYKPCGKSMPTPKCERKEEAKPRYHGKSTYSVMPNMIERELVESGPVEAAFTVYADFLLYKSGVYKHTSGEQLGGHAIKVMGFGVEKGEKYWLVANSWNTDWGDNGTFKIAVARTSAASSRASSRASSTPPPTTSSHLAYQGRPLRVTTSRTEGGMRMSLVDITAHYEQPPLGPVLRPEEKLGTVITTSRPRTVIGPPQDRLLCN
eukprot:CAMPEP_0180141616 /NCGR_PEP_ID=MMETSP0986-20121125/15032_1 /TAXON_ID=697907 /ORGANISM="non described non described, Strain CCMP2293" /LENGTH=408 /DNA_ID=CAMNT_0022084539 /DNA_START=21 /DNA_END=1248 /DNA_ORIENTATION=+